MTLIHLIRYITFSLYTQLHANVPPMVMLPRACYATSQLQVAQSDRGAYKTTRRVKCDIKWNCHQDGISCIYRDNNGILLSTL